MKKRILLSISILLVVVYYLVFSIFRSNDKILNNSMIENNFGSSLAVYIENNNGEYDASSSIPLKDSGYEFAKAVCKDDVIAEWDSNKWSLIIPNNVDPFKCNLYFNIYEDRITIDDILAFKNISTRTDFTTTYTADTTGTVYSAADDDGTSYYYAGAPTDNYVKFAGYYWRIIRINGDGTLRLIYQGSIAAAVGENTQIGTSLYNEVYDQSENGGYMYTSGSARGTSTSSNIKINLDNWYISKLKSYDSYIDVNAGFCNDRVSYTNTSATTLASGVGRDVNYFAAYIRIYTNKAPSLKCTNSSDLFTINGSNKGNKSLSYPIGTITADEVAYAGGVYNTNNTKYYLYTNQDYWTMTPEHGGIVNTMIGVVKSTGAYNSFWAGGTLGVRPVINLRADVTLTGSGTTTDPYIVSS